jgi:hypothetical protein
MSETLSSFGMVHLQLGIRCGALIQTPKHAILPSQVECCANRHSLVNVNVLHTLRLRPFITSSSGVRSATA